MIAQEGERRVAQLVSDYEQKGAAAESQLDAEPQRTLEIQAEVEKQVAYKRQELTEREHRINQDSCALSNERSMREQMFQQQQKELVELRAQVQKMQRKPEVFRMDRKDSLDDTGGSGHTQQVESDHLLAMHLEEESTGTQQIWTNP